MLTAYWIVPPSPHGPLGFGVTARSLDDALNIIRQLGYESFLPENLETLTLRENVTFAELEPYVASHMGPIVVRGMWYPFGRVGVSE